MAETELAKTESIVKVEAYPERTSVEEGLSRPSVDRIEEHAAWPLLSRMTVIATAGIPLSGFKIGDLLRLKPGELVESDWPHTEDIQVKAGRVQAAWSEFEVAEQRLLVRITRLA